MSDHEGTYQPTTHLDIDRVGLLRSAHLHIAQGKTKWRKTPLWVFMRDLCCVGSTSAGEICASLGWNAHQDAAKPLPRS